MFSKPFTINNIMCKATILGPTTIGVIYDNRVRFTLKKTCTFNYIRSANDSSEPINDAYAYIIRDILSDATQDLINELNESLFIFSGNTFIERFRNAEFIEKLSTVDADFLMKANKALTDMGY